jgi:hypothetical protein
MLETNDSSNNNSECEPIEYLSESESKEMNSSIAEKKSNVKKSFVQYDS